MAWSALTHEVDRAILHWNQNNPLNTLAGKRLLVAYSGGLDSTVLLSVLCDLRSRFRWEIALFHGHHGETADLPQQNYRDQALVQARFRAQALSCPFFFAKASRELHSEADFREFRLQEIQKVTQKWEADLIVWGHHQEDLLETRLLRLIRGTGMQGLGAMSWLDEKQWRPFISVSKSTLKNEAKQRQLEFVDDPSNQSSQYLRNWIRHHWLPALEDKSPGAVQSLGRSLAQLSESLNFSVLENGPERFSEVWADGHLVRPAFLALSEAEKSQCLAIYLCKMGSQNYTRNHIREIMKHLDIPRREHRFECAQMTWFLSADRIEARPVHVANSLAP